MTFPMLTRQKIDFHDSKIFASVQDIVNAILYTIGNKKYEKKVSKSITILRNSFACFSNIFVHSKWLRR